MYIYASTCGTVHAGSKAGWNHAELVASWASLEGMFWKQHRCYDNCLDFSA